MTHKNFVIAINSDLVFSLEIINYDSCFERNEIVKKFFAIVDLRNN